MFWRYGLPLQSRPQTHHTPTKVLRTKTKSTSHCNAAKHRVYEEEGMTFC